MKQTAYYFGHWFFSSTPILPRNQLLLSALDTGKDTHISCLWTWKRRMGFPIVFGGEAHCGMFWLCQTQPDKLLAFQMIHTFFLSLALSLSPPPPHFFFSLFFSASLCGEKIQTEKVPKYQLFPAKLSYVCSPSYGDSAPPCLTTTLLTELLGK